MLVGYRLSHPTNISETNPFGWSRNFKGRWWDFLEQLRRERISRIYLRGAFGSDYNGYLTRDHCMGMSGERDFRAFRAAFAEYNGLVLFDPVPVPIVPYNQGVSESAAYYTLFDGLVTRGIIEAFLKEQLPDGCIDVIIPNKFVRNDWSENLATWDADVNFIGRTKGIAE